MRLFLVLAVLGLASCGGGSGEVGELSLTVSPSSVTVIPADDFSCEAIKSGVAEEPDITGPIVRIRKMNITWGNANKLYISSIQIKVTSDGLSSDAVCDLNSQEIDALFSGSPGYSDMAISGGAEIESSDGCRILCGGLSLKTKNEFEISGSGEVNIIGYYSDGDKDTNVKASTTFEIAP